MLYTHRQTLGKRMRWARHVACMGKKRNVYMDLMGKTEGRRPFGANRYRWGGKYYDGF